LRKARNKRLSFWGLLNSSFVLWLLSSVVLTAAAAQWRRAEERQRLLAESRLRDEHIRIEITSRLIATMSEYTAWGRSDVADDPQLPSEEAAHQKLVRDFAYLKTYNIIGHSTVESRDQYAGRTMWSLLIEYAELRPDLRQNIYRAQGAIYVLDVIQRLLDEPVHDEFSWRRLEHAVRAVRQALVLELSSILHKDQAAAVGKASSNLLEALAQDTDFAP
jgi:hypothetical protein